MNQVGTFSPYRTVDSSAFGAFERVQVGDFNKDDHLDAVSVGASILWHENDGNLLPAFTRHVVSASQASSVVAIDLDQDPTMITWAPLFGAI